MEKENNLGQGQRDYGMQGDILIAVRQMLEQNRQETHHLVAQTVNELRGEVLELNGASLGRYEPSKSDRICQYLSMLYEAQKVDHNVHTEIDEALKKLREETGI
jgi:hypothetical protein